MDYTQEQIEEAQRILASVNGKKSGRSGWDKLTKEQQQGRINKMVKARLTKQRVDRASAIV